MSDSPRRLAVFTPFLSVTVSGGGKSGFRDRYVGAGRFRCAGGASLAPCSLSPVKGRGGAAQCYYEEKDSVRKGFYPLLRAGALAGRAGEEGAGLVSFSGGDVGRKCLPGLFVFIPIENREAGCVPS